MHGLDPQVLLSVFQRRTARRRAERMGDKVDANRRYMVGRQDAQASAAAERAERSKLYETERFDKQVAREDDLRREGERARVQADQTEYERMKDKAAQDRAERDFGEGKRRHDEDIAIRKAAEERHKREEERKAAEAAKPPKPSDDPLGDENKRNASARKYIREVIAPQVPGGYSDLARMATYTPEEMADIIHKRREEERKTKEQEQKDAKAAIDLKNAEADLEGKKAKAGVPKKDPIVDAYQRRHDEWMTSLEADPKVGLDPQKRSDAAAERAYEEALQLFTPRYGREKAMEILQQAGIAPKAKGGDGGPGDDLVAGGVGGGMGPGVVDASVPQGAQSMAPPQQAPAPPPDMADTQRYIGGVQQQQHGAQMAADDRLAQRVGVDQVDRAMAGAARTEAGQDDNATEDMYQILSRLPPDQQMRSLIELRNNGGAALARGIDLEKLTWMVSTSGGTQGMSRSYDEHRSDMKGEARQQQLESRFAPPQQDPQATYAQRLQERQAQQERIAALEQELARLRGGR